MTHHGAFEHHDHDGTPPCGLCSGPVDTEHTASVSGLCHHCVYRILIVVLIVMITISYVAWFGVL